ncbi:hypothetical protein FsymDg_1467 [Candidatus Protofrankia datiscae]|uniref:Uncharacterized protein n=1 Tax=Candidatus Protofrankia datiscae TaxID=2716812 RepID=F8B2V1_9ACTN|nr:GNAT family N-acetyltransferase [Candidatus Protofrankia datiscae]AEH08933.1 hypothetical protein FsymDg_1467 [Candidatus Protofrankia datiscae]
MRPVISTGPTLSFFSVNKERLLADVLGRLSVLEAVAAGVLRKVSLRMRERMEENEEGGIGATGIIILMTTVEVRVARPEDYDDIVSVVDDWWGRPVSTGLPRLFLDHFHSSSRVGEDSRGLAGFLVAFLSPAQPGVGYVHFVGVRPDRRGAGLARLFVTGQVW